MGNIYSGNTKIKSVFTGSTPVKYVFNGNTLVWEKEEPVTGPEYLCFTNIDSSSGYVTLSGYSASTVSVEYSTDNVNWNSYTLRSQVIMPTTGSKVYFRAASEQPQQFSTGDNRYHKFTSSVKVTVAGDITTLLSKAGNLSSLTTTNTHTFYALFYGMDKLTDASQLKLPSQVLVEDCYKYLFWKCTSLTATPELPAQNMAYSCYEQMFQECTSLSTPPVLSAMNLYEECYHFMFYNCTSLTSAPELPAKTLANNCYDCMFMGCTSLSTPPVLSVTTLADYCYLGMFFNCTSLTAAPELPATTMTNWCYQWMFENCTSLSTAPVLPATELDEHCYYEMFMGCTSLSIAVDDATYGTEFLDTNNITTATEWNTNMFKDTKGPNSGAVPTTGHKYYYKSA